MANCGGVILGSPLPIPSGIKGVMLCSSNLTKNTFHILIGIAYQILNERLN